jgi:hypothetical protein
MIFTDKCVAFVTTAIEPFGHHHLLPDPTWISRNLTLHSTDPRRGVIALREIHNKNQGIELASYRMTVKRWSK